MIFLVLLDNLCQSLLIPSRRSSNLVCSCFENIFQTSSSAPDPTDRDGDLKRAKLSPDAEVSEEPEPEKDLDKRSLWERLQDVDPERASQLHPNDTRKITRSLQGIFINIATAEFQASCLPVYLGTI